MDRWRNAVKVVGADALRGKGRATAFDFAGTGGEKTWIGTVTNAPGSMTGMHHHGRHEVAVYVVKGRSEIRWGERLEYVAVIGEGDFAYFAPYVPHQERNLSDTDPQVFLVVRSGNEGYVTKLDGETIERPETVY
jgi:uncharacterized RmlC-like cupin family protein